MTEKLVQLPDFVKLSERVVRILGLNPNKFTLQGTNTYLIGTGAQRILLDTGEGIPEYCTLLASSLKQIGDNVVISDILISHWHKDHVGGLEDVIKLSRENAQLTPTVHKVLNSAQDKPSHTELLQHVVDNQIFHTEGATLRAITTPGHSEDHVAFYLEEENAVFAADAVLGQGTTVFEDLGKYLDSLKKMKQFKPSRIYPGHGPVIEDGISKIDEYLKHRSEREHQILKVFHENYNQPLTPGQIVQVIYFAYPKSVWPAAEKGVIIHLKKLEDEGKVKRLMNSGNNDAPSLKGEWALQAGVKI